MESLETHANPPPNPGAAIGRPSPDFSVEAFEAGRFHHLDSADCRGSWMVLVFYPGDFDGETARLLSAFADAQDEFDRRGARVVSVSPDPVQVHRAWVETTHELSAVRFPMAGNADEQVVRAFELMDASGEAPLRAVVCIDPHGIVKSVRIGELTALEPRAVLDDLDLMMAAHEHGEVRS